MPNGFNDFSVTIAGDGTATSPLQFADYIYNFSTKCDDDAAYNLELVDNDNFGIDEFNDNVGPIAEPVNRKCKNFFAVITNGTPGKVIEFRVGSVC